MPVKREILQQTLEKAFPNADINLVALTSDDDHWEVSVRSERFSGLSKIAQHRMVNDAVKDLNIHAVSIKTMI